MKERDRRRRQKPGAADKGRHGEEDGGADPLRHFQGPALSENHPVGVEHPPRKKQGDEGGEQEGPPETDEIEENGDGDDARDPSFQVPGHVPPFVCSLVITNRLSGAG
jgi:hypothetical protein